MVLGTVCCTVPKLYYDQAAGLYTNAIVIPPTILADILIILSATAFYSIGVILMRKVTSVPVFQTQAWVSFYSVPVFLVMTAIFEEDQVSQILNVDIIGVSMVLYTSILSTIVGYGGINFLLRRFPVTLISPFMVSVPVFATMSTAKCLEFASNF